MENLSIVVENVFQPSQFAAATSSAPSSFVGGLTPLFWWSLAIIGILLIALYFSLQDTKRDEMGGYLQP